MRTRDSVKYGRVSSKEQEKEGFSIPAQWKLLDQYAKAEGFRVVREFVDVETAKKNLVRAQQSQIEQADRHRRAMSYQAGDQVLLSTNRLSSHNSKLRAKFIGPFPIKKVWSDVLVELDLPAVMSRRFNKFHISRLREWKEGLGTKW